MRTIVISTILIAIFSTFGFSQTDEENRKTVWTKFTSKNGSFSVDLPEKPTEELSIEISDELKLFRCAKSISYYKIPGRYDVKKFRLVLREVDVTGCKRTPADFTTDFRGFFEFLAGPSPKVHSDRVLDNGPHEGAREVLYHSGAFYPGTKNSAIKNRVRAIDAGSRVFILVFFREEGDMGEEDKIFNTFRLNNEKRVDKSSATTGVYCK